MRAHSPSPACPPLPLPPVQEEYKIAYKQLFGKEEGFEETWAKLDKDGDGNLTVEELATYYGFSMDGADTGSSNEMTDEQILEALQLASTLASHLQAT